MYHFVVAAKKRFDEIMRQMTDSEEDFNDGNLENNCEQVPIIQQSGNCTFNVINLDRRSGSSDSYTLSRKREVRIPNSNTNVGSYPTKTAAQFPSNRIFDERVPGNIVSPLSSTDHLSPSSLQVRSFPPVRQSRVESTPFFPVSDMRSPNSPSTPSGYSRTETPGSSQSVRY